MRGPWGRLLGLAFASVAATAFAQSPPPPPDRYFNDYAGVVAEDLERRLDDRLRRFDEETTTQVLVVVYPSLPSASLEDFTARAAQAWRAGRTKLHNGAVLFVFVEDRRSRLEVGYGLEGAIPDLRARQILDEVMAPAFRDGDYGRGLDAGVEAILAAARGEYAASPRPREEPAAGPALSIGSPLCFLLSVAFLIWLNSRGARRGRTYRRGGFRGGPWYWGGGGWGGGGGFGGGGWGGGGGGGFSGGGGSFGGGGASGSW